MKIPMFTDEKLETFADNARLDMTSLEVQLAHTLLKARGVYDKVSAQRDGLQLFKNFVMLSLANLGGWREAIAETEDFCHDPVRLKNMQAALDQIDALSAYLRNEI